MSWLEGLTQDDWREWHSDSEVQTTAQAALELLKEQESMEPIYQERSEEYVCAKCGRIVWKDDSYCSKCGQKVKWK